MGHRTRRVLLALRDSPGASNRGVAELAGIRDEAQTARMMARLAELGLVRNDPHDGARGRVNAWTLTTEGVRLVRTLDVAAVRQAGDGGELASPARDARRR